MVKYIISLDRKNDHDLYYIVRPFDDNGQVMPLLIQTFKFDPYVASPNKWSEKDAFDRAIRYANSLNEIPLEINVSQ